MTRILIVTLFLAGCVSPEKLDPADATRSCPEIEQMREDTRTKIADLNMQGTAKTGLTVGGVVAAVAAANPIFALGTLPLVLWDTSTEDARDKRAYLAAVAAIKCNGQEAKG